MKSKIGLDCSVHAEDGILSVYSEFIVSVVDMIMIGSAGSCARL